MDIFVSDTHGRGSTKTQKRNLKKVYKKYLLSELKALTSSEGSLCQSKSREMRRSIRHCARYGKETRHIVHHLSYQLHQSHWPLVTSRHSCHVPHCTTKQMMGWPQQQGDSYLDNLDLSNFACFQAVQFCKPFSELFLFSLQDHSFPCRYFFSRTFVI